MADNLILLAGATSPRSAFSTRLAQLVIGFFATTGILAVLVTVLPVAGWWARAYSGPIEQPKGDVLVILSAANDDHGFISFSSYWRTRYALTAWRTGGFRQVVITGGGGPGIRDFLIAEGVPSQDILAEWQSKSTHDSGIACAHLLQGIPGRKVLLTSDFHMYRSIRVFRKAGIEIAPMPVPDVLKASRHLNGRLPAFETMVVETTKIVGYRLRGWI